MLGLSLCLVLFSSILSASEPLYDLPLVDTPFTFRNNGYLFPSMNQSLALSTDFYEGVHQWIGGSQSETAKPWRRWAIFGFDVLTQWTPLGSGWMHEEWHRAVMSNRGIASFDEMNTFPIGRDLISVSHVTDEDLIRLKRDHPADQVRLSEAGMESQIQQNLLIENHHFFADLHTRDSFLLWLNDFSVTSYLWTCGSKSADSSTDQQNSSDGAEISKRDFTGLDCTAWAYDLFRPEEPYTARGTHPSGVGVNRYIHYSDLTGHEQSFLRRQVLLSLLNFADPFLVGRESFNAGTLGHWNARASHTLTSFGYSADAHLYWRQSDLLKFHFMVHNGFNDKTYFPGLSAEWADAHWLDHWSVTSVVTLWNQPRGQRFDALSGSLLAAASTRWTYDWSATVKPYAGVEMKTPGWMAGQVALERDVTLWLGLFLQSL